MILPQTRYAKSGDVSIAYQVMGSGPFDLVFVPGFVSNLDGQLENPGWSHFFSRLSNFSRLIRLDKRGTGLSDRVAGIANLEDRMDDVRAVMDAAGSEPCSSVRNFGGRPYESPIRRQLSRACQCPSALCKLCETSNLGGQESSAATNRLHRSLLGQRRVFETEFRAEQCRDRLAYACTFRATGC